MFISGRLYDSVIRILTIDSDFNILTNEMKFKDAINIVENNSFTIKNNLNKNQTIQLILYFDQINEFLFESDTVKFLMFFDRYQDFEQINVVHQEIRISTTFGNFFATTYVLIVNNVLLSVDTITIHDYSFEDRSNPYSFELRINQRNT